MLRVRSLSKIAGAFLILSNALSTPVAAASEVGGTPGEASRPLASPPDVRLAAVGYRLSRSNSQRCVQPQALTGLMLHDRSSYDQGERDSIAQRYALGGGFGILNVVPGSAAERAGLRAGDVLIRLADSDLSTFATELVGRRGSYARVAAFFDRLRSKLSAGSTVIIYRRGGE